MNVLLVVAKRPAAGQTKTRLSPPLSPQQAAGLYECFLHDTLALMRQIPAARRGLAYLPAGEEAYFRRLTPDFDLLLQTGPDLGSRLDHAAAHYLENGYEKVVIMDSDSPTLPVETLAQAFQALGQNSEVVLGPCLDGGYYLIGLTRPAPRLLREVPMSTPHVLADTLALAASLGLKTGLLPAWYDIDDAASLERLRQELKSPGENAPHTRRFFQSLGFLQPGE